MKQITRAVLFAVGLAIGACSNGAMAREFVLAHTYSEESNLGIWARDFQQCVKDKEDIVVEIIPSQLIGDSMEIAESVFHGELDMAILPASIASYFWPAAKALTLPGVLAEESTLMEYSNENQFVESVEKAIARDWPVHIMGIGWRHAVFAGNSSVIDGLSGHRIYSYSDEVSTMLRKLGAVVAERSNTWDAIYAWKSGLVDGMFLDSQFVRMSLDEGLFSDQDVIFLDDTYVPFKEAQLLLMNPRSSRGHLSEIADRLRWSCRNVSDDFNRRGIDRLREIQRLADFNGIRVEALVTGHESEWREAIEASWNESIVSSRGAVKGVLDILRDYDW